MQAIPALFTGGAAGTGLATGLAVASTAMSVLGTIQSMKAARAAAEANAQIAETNAERALANAEKIVFASSIEAQDQDAAARAEIGAFLAESGASGLSMGSGSKLLQRKSQEELAAQDRGRIRYQGDVARNDFFTQAQDYLTGAHNAREEGRFAAMSGFLDIGTSLISGASTINKIKQTSLAQGA